MTKADPRRDDTAYVEGLLEKIDQLEIENTALRARNNLLEASAPPRDWYHTHTGIFRPHRDRKGIPDGRVELLMRRLNSGLIMTSRREVWDWLIDILPVTPPVFRATHGGDAAE